MDYWCFRREDSGKGKGSARIETSGSSKIAMVPGSATTSLDTAEIILRKQREQALLPSGLAVDVDEGVLRRPEQETGNRIP